MQVHDSASKIPVLGKIHAAFWPRATNNLPGPGGLPLLGLGPEMIRDSLGLIRRLQHSYGDIVSLPLPGMKGVLTCDPGLIRLALLKTESGFGKSALYQRMERVFGKGMVTSEGKNWKNQRHTLNPAFLQSSVLRYTGLIYSEIDRFKRTIPAGGGIVALRKNMTEISFRILLRTFFPGCPDSSAGDLRSAFETVSEFAVGLMWNVWTPPHFIPTPGNIKFNKAYKILKEFIDNEVRSRSACSNSDESDLIKMLLSAKDEKGKLLFRESEICDQVLTILFAGHDTTANTLAFALWLLASDPEVTLKLRKQITEVLGEQQADHKELHQLSELNMTVNECMRLFPTAWMINRVNHETVYYKNYEFPPGTTFFLPQYLVHRHKDHWERPEKFWPAHFAPERVKKRHKSAFFPFAAGPRNCIGIHLATMELKLIILELIRDYDLVLTDVKRPELTASITMFPASEITLEFKKLRH